MLGPWGRLPPSEAGHTFPQGVGPGLWDPWQSQATQAPRKTWVAAYGGSQLGGSCNLWSRDTAFRLWYLHLLLCLWAVDHSRFTPPLAFARNGNPLQNSCLENPMDRGAWWTAVHGVAKSQTQLSNFTFTFHFHALEKEMATHSSILAWRISGTVGWRLWGRTELDMTEAT